jgi:NAD(P)-dependent dehydrogenase (short-subunit alcohol dehydrogenase family)
MSEELFSVAGQNVIITGGSRGIGRAIAEGFAARGANVLICSRTLESVETAVKEMNDAGLKADGVACDVSDEQQILTTVQTAISRLGHIDTLVNVAGVNRR